MLSLAAELLSNRMWHIWIFVALAISVVIAKDDLETIIDDLKNMELQNFVNNSQYHFEISDLLIDNICSNVSSKNISASCANELEIVCNNGGILAQMMDAWSKFPYSGMLVGTKRDLGTFDQCTAIDHRTEDQRVLGKHCTYGLLLPANLNFTDFYALSYCMPESCSPLDLGRLVTIDSVPEVIVTSLINDRICSTKESNRKLDASSIIVACLFCGFFGLVILSTAYEVFLYYRQLKNKIPLLTAFSIFTNGQKLTQITHGNGNGDQILVFHGIKVISMMWILAGHGAGVFSVLPVTNDEEMNQFEYVRYSQYLLTAHLAVDTFFFISGFLLAYQYFKSSANKPIIVQFKSIPQMIIHRYLRITPVVLMFFLYSIYLSKHIGSGPLFTSVHEALNKPCYENWWAVFLYIQNYYNPTDLCYVHLWYLSADWQLFLLAPLILIPMASQYKRRFGMVMVGMIILNVFFLLVALFSKLVFPEFDKNDLEYETHAKLATYFMGVMFGFYLRCQRHKPYLFRKGSNTIMWIMCLLMMFVTILVLHEFNTFHDSHVAKSLCHVLIKPVWCLGLMFVIYSCTHGYGGVVNWFLTAGWMQVVSKLTYCMYIVHGSVISYWLSTSRTREYFSDFKLFFYWCGHLIITLIVSVAFTLTFESPLIVIERMLMGGAGKSRNNNKADPTTRKAEDKPNGNIAVINQKEAVHEFI